MLNGACNGWYNGECSYEASSICNVNDGTASAKTVDQQVIGGFRVTWQLAGSHKPKENLSQGFIERGNHSWRAISKQGLRRRNWMMVLILSLVQQSHAKNLEDETVLKAMLGYRWSRDIIIDSPCLNESQIFEVIHKTGQH